MAVKIIVDPPKEVRPAGSIRCDVGWKLFLPDMMGDIPSDSAGRFVHFSNWIWWELSARLGYMRSEVADPVWIITPQLTEAGLDYIVRICSIWSPEVYAYYPKDGNADLAANGKNLWTPPVVNVMNDDPRDPAVRKLISREGDLVYRYLTPLLGSTKAFYTIYVIPPGGTRSRMHSHTAREEVYIVLEGKGTVRYGDHTIDISEGDLISKPLGPDVPTQLLADRGVPLRILDTEIWPDPTRTAKDVLHYPDHGEIDFLGPGWDVMIPDKAMQSSRDSFANYDKGYERNPDGSWTAKDVPGFRRREK